MARVSAVRVREDHSALIAAQTWIVTIGILVEEWRTFVYDNVSSTTFIATLDKRSPDDCRQ